MFYPWHNQLAFSREYVMFIIEKMSRVIFDLIYKMQPHYLLPV